MPVKVLSEDGERVGVSRRYSIPCVLRLTGLGTGILEALGVRG
jgi:hypothetical protein